METRTVARGEFVESRGVLDDYGNELVSIESIKRKPRHAIACAQCRMLGFRCSCTKNERVPVDANGSTKASRAEKRRKMRMDQGLAPFIYLNISSRPLPPNPTRAWPGSDEKIRVMEERERLGFQLFHPHDR